MPWSIRVSWAWSHPLNEALLLCLLATLAGAETFVDIALFGVKKRELLRRFLPFAKGTPSHDHLGDLFATTEHFCMAAQCLLCSDNSCAWVRRLWAAQVG